MNKPISYDLAKGTYVIRKKRECEKIQWIIKMPRNNTPENLAQQLI